MEMNKSAVIECEEVPETDEDSIPLADDDASAVVDEDNSDKVLLVAQWKKGHESLDSIPSMISDSLQAASCSSAGPSSLIGITASHVTEQMTRMCLDPDFSPDEAEEKARLITQVSKKFLPCRQISCPRPPCFDREQSFLLCLFFDLLSARLFLSFTI